MRQQGRFARIAKIFHRAGHRVGRMRVGTAFDPLRVDRRAQVNRHTIGTAMLLQRTGSECNTAKAQDDRASLVRVGSEEFMFEPLGSDRAIRPCFTGALRGVAPDCAGQIAHQGLARARAERHDTIVLDPNAGTEVIGKELSQVDWKAAAKSDSSRLPSGRFAGSGCDSAGKLSGSY
jgi:hypothetical protein